MKTIPCILLLVALFTGAFAQTDHEQLVPLPAFAEYHASLTEDMKGIHSELGSIRESMSYQDGERLSYKAVASDLMVYTTSLPIDRVRSEYIDLFLDAMQADGAPPEAVEQFHFFLEKEVVSDIEQEQLIPGDLNTLENYYEQSGVSLPSGYFDCMRKLQQESGERMSSVFLIEMDEAQYRSADAPNRFEDYTVVEVEVQQPFIDTQNCRITEETAIIYQVYDMVMTVE